MYENGNYIKSILNIELFQRKLDELYYCGVDLRYYRKYLN